MANGLPIFRNSLIFIGHRSIADPYGHGNIFIIHVIGARFGIHGFGEIAFDRSGINFAAIHKDGGGSIQRILHHKLLQHGAHLAITDHIHAQIAAEVILRAMLFEHGGQIISFFLNRAPFAIDWLGNYQPDTVFIGNVYPTALLKERYGICHTFRRVHGYSQAAHRQIFGNVNLGGAIYIADFYIQLQESLPVHGSDGFVIYIERIAFRKDGLLVLAGDFRQNGHNRVIALSKGAQRTHEQRQNKQHGYDHVFHVFCSFCFVFGKSKRRSARCPPSIRRTPHTRQRD